MNWWLFVLWLVAAALSSILCAMRAKRQGYSVVLYAGLALLLGPGAVLVTRLSTQDPLRDAEDNSEFARWRRRYHATRERLCLFLVMVVGSAVIAVLLASQCIMSRYAALMGGMSIVMPAPTRLLLAFTTWSLAGVNLAWLLLAALILPVLLYLCASRSGYAAPVFGSVWRITDLIWMQRGLLAGDAPWQQRLPRDVGKRLQTPLAQEQLGSLQQQEDRLATALVWAIVRLSPVATLTIYFVVLTFLGLLLPMLQLVGWIGG